MTPSELADKLEQGGIFRITPEEEALRTKCVRFAADMEKLVVAENQSVSITEYHDGIYLSPNDGVAVKAKCIYAAARKAVEELEKGR